ncbi:MAG: hypothetical protein M0R51_06890 [Clostridia bacterium]|jgi:uncharacterized protein (DUF111 family)|nr:hypothetical protein [Clostridia bacterium]
MEKKLENYGKEEIAVVRKANASTPVKTYAGGETAYKVGESISEEEYITSEQMESYYARVREIAKEKGVSPEEADAMLQKAIIDEQKAEARDR